MAEAAVEDRPAQKFYCHMCTASFENASPNFTCPHCSGGFIEELETNTAENAEADDVVEIDDEDPYNLMNFDMLELLMGAHRTPRPRYVPDPTRRRRYASVPRHRSVRPRSLTRLASSNIRPNSFENLIHDFIFNLGVGWGGAAGGAAGPNVQFFLGNPGDYAWDREGLDAIVTQLLNQMDGTGPPPLSKDVIATIPTVPVTQEQVDAKLQCSICWEDFNLNENVRKLPCQHVYHEGCICPWLELHGTCPICRQNLGPSGGEQQTNEEGDGNTSRAGNNFDPIGLAQIIQAVQNNGNRTTPTSSTSTSSSDTSSSSNSTSSSSSSSSNSGMDTSNVMEE